jgi:hypothetical protein
MLNVLMVNFGKVQSKDMAAAQNLYPSLHLMFVLFINHFPFPKAKQLPYAIISSFFVNPISIMGNG